MKDKTNRKAEVPPHKSVKWTYEKCLELARFCEYATELKSKSNGAYVAARKNGWLKTYVWFKNPHVGYVCKNSRWTESTCREVALKYKVKRDFKESEPSAYTSALYHGWYKDYTWLRDGRDSGVTRNIGFKAVKNFSHSHPKYTNEQIIEAAKKYIKKVDFLHNDNALYHAALNRGLMPQFTWLKSSAHLYDTINYVYRYYFAEQNAVYVGRTIKPEERDFDHHRERGEESSAVLKFARENGTAIPKMEILEKGLSGIESQIKEDEYVKKYRAEGMEILNKGATGLGRGSMGMKKKYSKQKFMEIAHRYETAKEFREKEKGAFSAGCQNGWIKECTFLKRAQRSSCVFSKEYCIEIARMCKSRKELATKDCTVYEKMLKNGWLDECGWLESAHKGYRELTHDECIAIARRYPNLTLMRKEQPTVVKKLYKTGWMNECTWLPWKNRPVIIQLHIDGSLIATYPTLHDAAQSIVAAGLTKSPNARISIADCCRGKKHTVYGFKWRYATPEDIAQNGGRNMASANTPR